MSIMEQKALSILKEVYFIEKQFDVLFDCLPVKSPQIALVDSVHKFWKDKSIKFYVYFDFLKPGRHQYTVQHKRRRYTHSHICEHRSIPLPTCK